MSDEFPVDTPEEFKDLILKYRKEFSEFNDRFLLENKNFKFASIFSYTVMQKDDEGYTCLDGCMLNGNRDAVAKMAVNLNNSLKKHFTENMSDCVAEFLGIKVDA